MAISKLFKQYFFGSSKTLILNLIIFTFCTIFVIISNNSSNKKIQSHTKIIISDFPPYIVDAFNSSIYGLGVQTYKSTTADKVELRQITLSWKRNDKIKDLQKIDLLKDRIIKIANKYIIFSRDHMKKIMYDFDNCLLYLYNDQSSFPEEVITIEANINYLNWFLENLEKKIIIERNEIKFTDKFNIIDVMFSSLFLSILFIILINFVRFQKSKL